MGARVDEQDLDNLPPFQRNGYVKVETDRGTYFLARKECEAFERALLGREEVFIGECPRGLSIGIRLRYGEALTVDAYQDWTPEALVDYHAEVAADRLKNGDG